MYLWLVHSEIKHYRGIQMEETTVKETEVKMEPSVATVKQADIEAVRDLFALAHDLIAQSTYPAHMHQKLGNVLNFLGFQYQDFKRRAEALAPKAVEVPAMTVQDAIEIPKS